MSPELMASSPAIRVEGIGKRYRIGAKESAPETLAGAVAGWFRAPMENLRALRRLSHFGSNESGDDVVWALRDVSFEVERGEVVGVIGRNGAGKSTLLKILTRITEPTEGRAEIHGKVASLLEVGTGFHQELTGRENVYLNGAVLGMSKAEIDRKFDEIVAFSGVEKFLDTPIKRYSSGMKVRLAFAVAAHLDAEILLIDEVLAVGDAAFRRKCLGKMDEVARAGRTVLFVSHSMGAVANLCGRCLYLDEGHVAAAGETHQIIQRYLNTLDETTASDLLHFPGQRPGSGLARFQSFEVLQDERGLGGRTALAGVDVTFKLGIRLSQKGAEVPAPHVCLQILTSEGVFLSELTNYVTGESLPTIHRDLDIFCTLRDCPLMPGRYRVNLVLNSQQHLVDLLRDAVTFDVVAGDFFDSGVSHDAGRQGVYLSQSWHSAKPEAPPVGRDQVTR